MPDYVVWRASETTTTVQSCRSRVIRTTGCRTALDTMLHVETALAIANSEPCPREMAWSSRICWKRGVGARDLQKRPIRGCRPRAPTPRDDGQSIQEINIRASGGASTLTWRGA